MPEPVTLDDLSPEIIRERLDYWTLILGPKFSPKERRWIHLSRFYAISQIEYGSYVPLRVTYGSSGECR